MTALNLVARPSPERFPAACFSDDYPLQLFGVPPRARPRLTPPERFDLLLSLGEAICELFEGALPRVTLRFDAGGEVWEAGLEVCRRDVLVSLYRPSPSAQVAAHERRVPCVRLVAAQIERLRPVAAQADRPRVLPTARRSRRLVAAASLLARLLALKVPVELPAAVRSRQEASGPSVDGLSFKAAGAFKMIGPGRVDCHRVERSDLHALLVEGSLTMATVGATVRSDRSQLFLDTERLVGGAQQVLSTWETGCVLSTRVRLSELSIALHRAHGDERLEVTVSGSERQGRRRAASLPSIHSLTWVRAVCHFAVALAGAFCAADDRQHRNLRLVALLRRARELLERASADEGSVENSSPEQYRRFARRRRSMASGTWERSGKMRFAPRWVATVPGLDLRATFLCGTNVIVDSSRETACIDRMDGKILWRAPSGPSACTVSPSGLVRFRSDGHLSCVDVATGETRFGLQLKPRPGGGAAGSLVHGEGLPKILALTEGDRQISAVDLVTGELKWRHTAARPGTYRLRRVGRLLLAGGGNGTLFALDLVTGEAVWRYCSRTPFSGSMAVDSRSAFAVSGAPGTWQLQHVNPWTGRPRWSVELAECPLPGRHPLLTSHAVVVPVGNESASGAEAFDRKTGRPLWRRAADLASATSAWATCDDLILVNDAAGVLTCLDAATGQLLFNHVFAGNCDADTPRRLEPVLRHGALFVPQQRVHVVRPRSGEIIGTVPDDLVPDLLRVDERCDVYVAEESGHLAAFGAAPHLALVG